QLGTLDREAEIGTAALHRVAARVLAEHEWIPGRAHVLGAHDLVGPAILQHAVLVDPSLVRERVAPDDSLVYLNALAGERRQHLAGRIDLLGVDARRVRHPIRADLHRHDDLFERRVAGALADAVGRALDLTCAALHGRK